MAQLLRQGLPLDEGLGEPPAALVQVPGAALGEPGQQPEPGDESLRLGNGAAPPCASPSTDHVRSPASRAASPAATSRQPPGTVARPRHARTSSGAAHTSAPRI
ncbi:hypothetical protein ACFFX1_02245 [Dactylosporangium sucinum]|uniref:hypothetical protein n=1 Tax=Dactylosporangium sucinum TaxID=1424081 RepID=UPI00167E044C|nr:hypothetical protein [Dactylosporangium sucinum]